MGPQGPLPDAAILATAVESAKVEPPPAKDEPAEETKSHDDVDAGTGVVPPPLKRPEAASDKTIMKVPGFKELLCTENGKRTFPEMKYSVDAGGASDFREMIAQEALRCSQWMGMPLPSRQEPYTIHYNGYAFCPH